jgi:hypothetical protein
VRETAEAKIHELQAIADEKTSAALEAAMPPLSDAKEVRKKAETDGPAHRLQLVKARAEVYRSHAAASEIALGATEAALLESQRADAAAQDRLMERDTLRDEVAKFSEPAMGVFLELLVPNGKADALKRKGVDSLATSVKAMDPESRQHWDYKRASNILLDGALEVCAGGDQDRVQMLSGNAVELFQKVRCRAGERWLESEEASAFRRFQANVIVAWRAAKISSDVKLARQILSLVASRRAAGEKGGRYS